MTKDSLEEEAFDAIAEAREAEQRADGDYVTVVYYGAKAIMHALLAIAAAISEAEESRCQQKGATQ